ncbi:MAG: DUF2812 domain-containing protein [Clostridiales bacterium]|nr:DUF2812 domain-containing protein [Clostridiales bacterium]
MKDVKRRLETFSLFDRAGIERHLARMAGKGWLLDKIGFLWTYRRIEPKEMAFSVCYFPQATVFDPEPTEEQQTFYDFCAHTGWTLAASSAWFQVFYNERPHPVPIETDPVTAVDAIHRVAKKNLLRDRVVMLVAMLMYGFLMASLLSRDPIRTLANGSLLWAGAGMLGLFVLGIMDLCGYFFWYFRARRKAARGEFLPASGHSRLRWAVSAWSAAALLLAALAAGSTLESVTRVLYAVGIFAGTLLVYGVRELLKRRKEPAESNRVITLTMSFFLAFMLAGTASYLSVNGSRYNWLGDGCATYEDNGHTYVDHQDDLPVTVEELTDGTNDGYTREREALSSFLLTRYEMRQWPRYDVEDYAEMAQLDYTIVEVKIPALYDLCRKAALGEGDNGQSGYEPVDPAPWGAAEVYRWIFQQGREGWFLLFYPDRVVEFGFYPGRSNVWEPTPAQMALVGERLGG